MNDDRDALLDLFVRFNRDLGQQDSVRGVLDLLVTAAVEELGAEVAVAYRVAPDGSLVPESSLGMPPEVDAPALELGMLGEELVRAVRPHRPELEHGRAYLMARHGDLYGVLVVLSSVPLVQGDRLPIALVEIATISLENVERQLQLQQSNEELRRSRERVARSESLRALGQMASVVAHEVKNPIAGVRGALQVLQRRFAAETAENRLVLDLIARLDSLNEMVHELLVFARPRPLRKRTLGMLGLLRSTVSFLHRSPDFEGVEVQLCGEDVVLPADAQQLPQVFVNLLTNAGQAMAGEGRIELTVERVQGMCRVVVRDHGPGVPADVRQRIFEPFFTTRTRGTGLGLAISRQIVEAHGGSMDVLEGPGGAFQVDLPLADL